MGHGDILVSDFGYLPLVKQLIMLSVLPTFLGEIVKHALPDSSILPCTGISIQHNCSCSCSLLCLVDLRTYLSLMALCRVGCLT